MDQQGGGVLMSVGIRADSILLSPARIPVYTAVGVATVLIAAGLGWLLAGPAIRPLRRLTEQTMRLGKGTDTMEAVTGAREAEELSDAMAGMLSRLAAAQQATTNSLQAAQDFAANAAHELRTPLTAMRADLDTLRIHDLPAEERDEVVGDLLRAQRRVEAIITALGQLASGQLAQIEDRELIDVTDMLDRVARENARVGGAVEIVVEADDDIGSIWGWPGGLRLAVDNLVRNAIPTARDGSLAAHRITSGEHDRARSGDVLTIIVDDNGRGLPAERAPDGAGPVRPGKYGGCRRIGTWDSRWSRSRRQLHGGSIELSDRPLGGLRATLTVTSSPEPEPDSDDGVAGQRRARADAPPRQPSSRMAVTSEATTTKLSAVPSEVALRNSIPTTTVHSQTISPVGASVVGRRQPRAATHPTAVPARNGHAVSATPARVMPSAWLRLPIVQNTSTHTTSASECRDHRPDARAASRRHSVITSSTSGLTFVSSRAATSGLHRRRGAVASRWSSAVHRGQSAVELEGLEYERKPLDHQRIRCAHHVEVQVRGVGVAGVAEVGDHLSGGEPIAGLDLDRAGLQVRVEARSCHRRCPARRGCRRTGRAAARSGLWPATCSGRPSSTRDDGTVGHGVDVGAEVRVALGLRPITVVDGAVGAQLHVVDGESFCGPELPLSGFIAIRWAVMSQQLLPSNQLGPVQRRGDDGRALWSETVTGATFSVMRRGQQRRHGFGQVHFDGVGKLLAAPVRAVDDDVQPDDSALWAGPEFRGRVRLPPRARVQYASWSPASVRQRLVAGLDGHRRQRSRPARSRW